MGHQRIAIAVHDEPRQTVGFTVHQTHAIALHIKSGSGDYGSGASSYKKRSINALCFVKAPGVAAQERALFARAKAKGFHAPDCAGSPLPSNHHPLKNSMRGPRSKPAHLHRRTHHSAGDEIIFITLEIIYLTNVIKTS